MFKHPRHSCCPFTAFFLMGGPAQAAPDGSGGNPHFIKSATTASLSGSDLVVKFKETGLQSGASEYIVATADFTGTYQCLNKAGHNPSDIKKTVDSEPVRREPSMPTRTATLSGSLTLSAADAAGVLECPSGQTATLTAWSYRNVNVTDIASGATMATPGTYSGGSKVVR